MEFSLYLLQYYNINSLIYNLGVAYENLLIN